MWSRKRLDIGWGDFIFAVARTAVPWNRQSVAAEIEGLWSPDGDMLVCLSVRSAFDLLLTGLNLPRGSELLVSAVTIGGMERTIHEHGLVPVPVDLDPATMAPREDSLVRGLSSRTRAVLVAHLFGSRIDLRPIGEFACRNGLLLIEDAAQAFDGTTYSGHPMADVSMFSFGPIKTATVLGGAVVRVRNRPLLIRMRELHAGWPVQKRREFFARAVKYAALKAISSRPAYGCLIAGCRWARCDHDRLVNGSVRAFASRDFLARIRRQPSAPLLSLLRHRLTYFDHHRLLSRVRRAEQVMGRWRGTRFFPASACASHAHWVLPLHTRDPKRVITKLAAAGFDATQGQSLIVISAPADRPDFDAIVARKTMAGIVYLPCYPEMTRRAIERLAAIVDEECRQHGSLNQLGLRRLDQHVDHQTDQLVAVVVTKERRESPIAAPGMEDDDGRVWDRIQSC